MSADEPVLPEEDLLSQWFVDLGDVQSKEILWIVRNMLPEGLTILGGPPKSGKSTLALTLAAAVAELQPQVLPANLCQVPNPGKVFIFSFESHAGFVRKIMEDGIHVKVPNDGRLMVAKNPYKVRLDNPDTINKLLRILTMYQPLLVVLDPFRNMHDQDENDSGKVINMLSPLHEWAMANSASIVLVHHTVKGGEDVSQYRAKHLRGSGAIFGMADGILMYSPMPSGKVNIDATFKYAPSWNRTFQLGLYDSQGEGGVEVLFDFDVKVLEGLKQGLRPGQIKEMLHTTSERITAALNKLQASGYIKKDIKVWRINAKKKVIV